VEAELDAVGCAVSGPLFDPDICAALAALYPEDSLFRSRMPIWRVLYDDMNVQPDVTPW
jgi:hypothetical protein